jgi:hypothetical protein
MIVDGQTAQPSELVDGERTTSEGGSGKIDVLAKLIGFRLMAAGKPSRSSILKALEPCYCDRADWNASKWRADFDAALEAAVAQGHIERKPLRLTADGRRAATAFLGFQSIPTNAKWVCLKNRYLVAAALGICPPTAKLERLGTAKGLYAATLVRHHNLPVDPVPTETLALDALAWHQLSRAHDGELPMRKRFTRNAVLAFTFFGGLTTKDPASRLAAIAADAAPRADKIRNALISRWIETMEKGSSESPASYQSAPGELADALEIGEFANKIRDLAVGAEQGRFGRHKVFISHLYRIFRGSSDGQSIDRETFNAYLLEAGRRGLLTLNRADLVEAMDPEDVRESEVRHPDGLGTFHFVRID